MAKGSTYSEFTPVSGDRLLGVDDPGGTPVTGAVDVDSIALTANNLSDLASAATARTNLGVLASGSAVSDNTLRDWAGRVASMLTTVTRTDYSESANYYGWIQVTATVTWPDGSSGHLDGVEYPDDLGVLQYFTASHADSGKIVVQSPLADGVAGVTVITPTYYVDSSASAGGDGTLATPYDAIADLPSLSSGNVIALASGSTFAETLTPVAGVSVYRYGSGAKPILDAGVTFTAGSWSATAGRTNVYEQAVTIELHASTSFVNVIEDGVHLSRVADVATCDSTPASFTVSADTGSGDTSVTVYIHATGSTNPTSNGSTYRYSRRLYSVAGLGLASLVLDGIVGRLQTHNNGSVVAGDSATLRHCEIYFGGKHNGLIGEGGTVRGCVITDAEYNSGAVMFVVNKDTATGGTTAIHDCYLDVPTYDSNIDGIYCHRNTGGTFGAVTVSRCYLANFDNGIDGINNSGITVNKCIINNCRESLTANVALTVDGVSSIHTAAHCQRICSINSALTVSLKRLYVNATGYVNGLIYSAAALTLTVQYCQIQATSQRGIYLTDASATLNHYDNHYTGSGWSQRLYIGAASTVNSNRNIWDNETGNLIYYNAVNYTTLAAWQSFSSVDAASSIGGADGSKVPS